MPLKDTAPTRTLITTSHSLRVPRISPASRTAHTQPAHTGSPPLRPTSPHAAWTAATPSFAPRVGGATSVDPHACTCPSQAVGQRPRRRRRAGPQGGRPQRPLAGPRLSGPAWCRRCDVRELILRVVTNNEKLERRAMRHARMLKSENVNDLAHEGPRRGSDSRHSASVRPVSTERLPFRERAGRAAARASGPLPPPSKAGWRFSAFVSVSKIWPELAA